MSYIDQFLFGLYPYIASVIFFLGSLLRYDREQYSWKAGSSQMLNNKNFRIASILFHIGVICIFFGHFAGLVVPYGVWHAFGISLQFKQVIAMAFGGLFGVMCFIGMTMLVKRRLTDSRVRATGSSMDMLILLLLYVQLILGLGSIFVSAGHMDGAVMHELMMWSGNLFVFRPFVAVEHLAQVHWIYKLHIVLGVTIFVLFPFSRLVHIWSVPVKYMARNYQIVRNRA